MKISDVVAALQRAGNLIGDAEAEVKVIEGDVEHVLTALHVKLPLGGVGQTATVTLEHQEATPAPAPTEPEQAGDQAGGDQAGAPGGEGSPPA